MVPEPKRNPKARISGRVLDEDGHPVPDALVRLADGGSRGGRDIQVRTDRSGAFTLGGLRPGSTYWLIAEVEDAGVPRTGRIRAQTAETGVEITLGDQGDGTPTESDTPTRATRARPISNRQESGDAPMKVNEEDLLPPAEEAEAETSPSRKTRAGDRPLLSAPEPGVGWKRPGETRQERAVSEPDPEESVPSAVASRRAGGADEDEGPNPLPPAIDTQRVAGGENDDSTPRPRNRKRAPVVEADSASEAGGLTLPPESNPEDVPTPRATKPRGTRKPKSEPGPPPMPSLDSTQATTEGPSVLVAESVPRLEPDPALFEAPPNLGSEVATTAAISPQPVAIQEPPRPEASPGPPSPSIPIEDKKPASQPVFASQEAGQVEAAPSPLTSTSEQYDPFKLAAEVVKPAPAVVAMVATSAPEPVVPASTATNGPVGMAGRSVDGSEATVASAPASRTKWGEIAPTTPRPRVLAETSAAPVVVPPRPNSIFARFRPRDPALAPLCDFDAKSRKLNDFRLPDLEGQPVRFRDLDADYVLLDFWGTWCNPCLDSIPHLIELQKQYGPGRLKVVGIACEKVSGEQRRSRVDAFARKLGMNYTVLLSTMDGTDPVQKAMSVRYYPTMVLLGRDGQVLWSAEGATPANLERLDRALESMTRGDSAGR